MERVGTLRGQRRLGVYAEDTGVHRESVGEMQVMSWSMSGWSQWGVAVPFTKMGSPQRGTGGGEGGSRYGHVDFPGWQLKRRKWVGWSWENVSREKRRGLRAALRGPPCVGKGTARGGAEKTDQEQPGKMAGRAWCDGSDGEGTLEKAGGMHSVKFTEIREGKVREVYFVLSPKDVTGPLGV